VGAACLLKEPPTQPSPPLAKARGRRGAPAARPVGSLLHRACCESCQHRFRPSSDAARAAARVIIGYVDIGATRATSRSRPTSGIVLKPRESPFAARRSGWTRRRRSRACQDRFRARAYHREIRAGGDASGHPGVERGIISSYVDAPAEAFGRLATAVRGREVLLLMRRRPTIGWRPDLCAREIVHTLPSLAMTSDAPCNIWSRASGATSWCCKGRCGRCRDHQGVRNSVKKLAPASLPPAVQGGTDPRERERTIRCCSPRTPRL